MSAVVDASLLVGALTSSGQEAQWCMSALDRSDIAAPEMALAETTNLFRRMELSGGITRLESTSAHSDLLDLGIELYPFRPFAEARVGTPGEPDRLRRLVCGGGRGAGLAAAHP